MVTAIANSITSTSSEAQSAKELGLALAMAECGNVEALWAISIEQPDTYFGTSKWQLALDPLYQRYFANIPEYQEMVETLQSNQEAKP